MHATIKGKLLRANHVSYMEKSFRKTVTKRLKIENNYVKIRQKKPKIV